MKRKLMVALVGVGLLAGTLAAPASAESGEAAQSACFGQARAAGAKAFQPMGQVISERKGDNAAQNAAFREECQAVVAP